MSTSHRRMLLAAAALAGVLCVAGCAAGPGSSPAPTSSGSPTWDSGAVVPPEGRVIGTGTVLDVAGETQLCLGAVAESYPPQCSGIPLDGWTWDGVDGSETSGDVTWGTYAVYGTYDGERYTVTDPPIMLALYDPVRPDDPAGGIEGTSSDADLARAQDKLGASLGDGALTLWTDRGYVWVQVVWDDGTLQAAVDAAYGEGVVFVTSALREID
ncbi:hypothetical protein [Microbacterium sp. CGR1]|uniref:hypothetical protein n=1 Tax=Microbacterium sp. CGR1 TaxID=1696072 RepID=UPI003DA388DA